MYHIPKVHYQILEARSVRFNPSQYRHALAVARAALKGEPDLAQDLPADVPSCLGWFQGREDYHPADEAALFLMAASLEQGKMVLVWTEGEDPFTMRRGQYIIEPRRVWVQHERARFGRRPMASFTPPVPLQADPRLNDEHRTVAKVLEEAGFLDPVGPLEPWARALRPMVYVLLAFDTSMPVEIEEVFADVMEAVEWAEIRFHPSEGEALVWADALEQGEEDFQVSPNHRLNRFEVPVRLSQGHQMFLVHAAIDDLNQGDRIPVTMVGALWPYPLDHTNPEGGWL